MTRAALALGAILAALLLPAAADASPRPFVYVVVIDGLDGDRVEMGKAPFISSLLAGNEDADATYFPGSRSVMPAVTNANHAAMMSGAFTDRSGVAGNAYAIYAPLEHDESCVRTGPLDVGVLPTETSGEHRSCARAEFIFESVRRQAGLRHPTTAAIMGKPKLGAIFAGQNKRPNKRDVDYLWAPCSSDPDDDEYCESVQTQPATGYALTDEIVMDEVVRSVTEGVRNRVRTNQRPRITFVNLPQVDSAGHAFGTGLPVYDQAIALADDEIERLVDTLRAEGIWDRSVLFLVSDHSMDTAPLKVEPSQVFSDAGIPDNAYLPVNGSNGSVELVYLADRKDPGRHELLKRMRDAIIAETGVGEAYYRRPNPADGGRQHTRKGWHVGGARGGDLFITSAPGYAFSDPGPQSNPVPGSHGAPQTSDNFLAIAGASGLVKNGTVQGAGRRNKPINVDIAPSVMRLFGLRGPADSRGRVLTRALERRALRR